MGGMKSFQCFQPIDAGQPDIQQDKLRHFFGHNLNRLFATARHQHLITFVLQDCLQRLADTEFIIYNKNSFIHKHHSTSFLLID